VTVACAAISVPTAIARLDTPKRDAHLGREKGEGIASIRKEIWYHHASFHPNGTNLFLEQVEGVEEWIVRKGLTGQPA